MPTGLEEVHAVTDRALKQLDADARRLNRSLNDTREDIVKAKAEYEQVVAGVVEQRAELEKLAKAKATHLKSLETHATEQVSVIEAAGKKLEAHAKKIAEAVSASDAKEQKAQESLSKFLETRGAFLQKVKTLQDALGKAIADLLA